MVEKTNYCSTCEKPFKTKAAYISHCKSKLHLAKSGKPIPEIKKQNKKEIDNNMKDLVKEGLITITEKDNRCFVCLRRFSTLHHLRNHITSKEHLKELKVYQANLSEEDIYNEDINNEDINNEIKPLEYSIAFHTISQTAPSETNIKDYVLEYKSEILKFLRKFKILNIK